MERTGIQYSTYVQILKEELVPAMGCTEPIALAYCAAKAREVLGCLPDLSPVSVEMYVAALFKQRLISSARFQKTKE